MTTSNTRTVIAENGKRAQAGALLYLAALATTEVVVVTAGAWQGAALNLALAAVLTVLALTRPRSALYLALLLPPFLRALSLALPVDGYPPALRDGIVALAMLLGAVACLRLAGLSRGWLGLTWKAPQAQVAVALLGLPLGLTQYEILRPHPLAASPYDVAAWLPACGVLVVAGLAEEVSFRGLLQRAATEHFRGMGVAFTAVAFALFHLGDGGQTELAFMLTVGLVFGLIATASGSIVGVSLAHAALNMVAFLIVPFFVAPAVVPPPSYAELARPETPLVDGRVPAYDGRETPAMPTPYPTAPLAVLAETPAAVAMTTPSPAPEPAATAAPPTPTPEVGPLPDTKQSEPLVLKPVVYALQPTDTLETVARRFRVSVEALKAWNGIEDERFLKTGTHLIVPVVLHTVAPGESVSSIAAKRRERVTPLGGERTGRPVDRRPGQRPLRSHREIASGQP